MHGVGACRCPGHCINATNNNPKYRTTNRKAVAGSKEDWTRFNPWRAPGVSRRLLSSHWACPTDSRLLLPISAPQPSGRVAWPAGGQWPALRVANTTIQSSRSRAILACICQRSTVQRGRQVAPPRRPGIYVQIMVCSHATNLSRKRPRWQAWEMRLTLRLRPWLGVIRGRLRVQAVQERREGLLHGRGRLPQAAVPRVRLNKVALARRH